MAGKCSYGIGTITIGTSSMKPGEICVDGSSGIGVARIITVNIHMPRNE